MNFSPNSDLFLFQLHLFLCLYSYICVWISVSISVSDSDSDSVSVSISVSVYVFLSIWHVLHIVHSCLQNMSCSCRKFLLIGWGYTDIRLSSRNNGQPKKGATGAAVVNRGSGTVARGKWCSCMITMHGEVITCTRLLVKHKPAIQLILGTACIDRTI